MFITITPDDFPAHWNLTEITLYSLIASLDTEMSQCFASIPTMARLCRCSDDTIRRTLKKFQENGVITIEARKGDTNIVRIVREERKSDPGAAPEPKTESPESVKISEEFEDFWKAYTPVKVKSGEMVDKGSKKLAGERYRVARKKHSHDEIMRGLQTYLTNCATNNRLTCNVAVFLSQERWKIETTPVIAVQNKSKHQMESEARIQSIMGNQPAE